VRKRIRRAPQANSNAALATASYNPDADFNGAAEITIQSATRLAPWWRHAGAPPPTATLATTPRRMRCRGAQRSLLQVGFAT